MQRATGVNKSRLLILTSGSRYEEQKNFPLIIVIISICKIQENEVKGRCLDRSRSGFYFVRLLSTAKASLSAVVAKVFQLKGGGGNCNLY